MSGINMKDVIEIAIRAGDEILDVYHSEDFQVVHKADQSPLTLADKRSHDVIVAGLTALSTQIPILSEEGKHLPFAERRSWEYVWIVDPLDGTKEFVKRNGEFTVNIALVHNSRPVMGVIYTPVLDVLYYAQVGIGSFRLSNARENAANGVEGLRLPLAHTDDSVYVVASRSHMSPETEEYLATVRAKYGNIEIKSAGSSLKMCLVAEGQADVYPRFAPTMEWDTCAGQVIAEQAGVKVFQPESRDPLVYNKENLLNPWFIVQRAGFDL